MGNCMNLRSSSSKYHHDNKEMESSSTTTVPNQQIKQPGRGELGIKIEGDRRRSSTTGVVVNGDVINIVSDEEGSNCKQDDDDNPNKQLGAGDKELVGMVRVKIVLTKEELQWLMNQLKSNGEKRLENMLEEIEKGRKKVVCDDRGKSINGWKPSLESIMETPERTVLEMNQSIN